MKPVLLFLLLATIAWADPEAFLMWRPNTTSDYQRKKFTPREDYVMSFDSAGLPLLIPLTVASGGGDVQGPSGAVNSRIAVFDGASGKIIGDGGYTISELLGMVTIADGDRGDVVVSGSGLNWALDHNPSLTSNILSAALGGTTQGAILYRGGSGWVTLAPGTAGQFLQSGGPAANPSWVTAAYLEYNESIADLGDAQLDYRLTLDDGYILNGPTVTALPAIVGNVMDITEAGGSITVTGPVTLTMPGTPAPGQKYTLNIQAGGVGPYTVTFPSTYNLNSGIPKSSIIVRDSRSYYLTFYRESSRWVYDGEDAETNGTGSFLLTTGAAAIDFSTSDEAYGPGWNGKMEVPTMNAIYDKIEALTLGGGGWSAGTFTGTGTYSGDTLYSGTLAGAATLTLSMAAGDHIGFILAATGVTAPARTITFPAANRVGYGGGTITTLEMVESVDNYVEFYSDGTDLFVFFTPVSASGTPSLTNNYVGFGAAGVLSGEAGFEYNPTTNTLSVPNMSIATLDTTLLNATAIKFEGSTPDLFETQVDVEDPTADRTWVIPNVSDTFAGLTAAQTLTNKTINLTNNSLTASSAQLRTAISDETGTGSAVFAGGNIGAATATTPATDDNDTSVATTAYVQGEIAGLGGGSNLNGSVSVTVDGGGSVLTAGTKGFVVVPHTGTVSGWSIVADQAGTITFDIEKAADGVIPTTSITPSGKPALAGTQILRSSSTTGWTTTSIDAFDVFEFLVTGTPTNVTRATLQLHYSRGTAGSFGTTVDGGGAPIAAGTKGMVIVPFACTITGWSIVADQSGTIVFDVERAADGATTSPTVDIDGSAPPTLSGVQVIRSTSVGTWNTPIAANDIIEFETIGTATNITRATLQIHYTR